jgi:pyruvate formate lyase activating enzyme
VCLRRCAIADGEAGWCGTRANRDGRLWSLIYGRVASLAVSPIEKKPLFHYFPGSTWLSLGSLGCNFRCPGCQNWDIAHALSDGPAATMSLSDTSRTSPAEVVRLARRRGCLGISFTYNEPALWLEYLLDTSGPAKAEGLRVNLVTNGSLSEAALDLLGPSLDAYRVDIKGFAAATYRRLARFDDFRPILATTERAKARWGAWVEIVTNVIPGLNDDDRQLSEIAGWICSALGEDTPWHVTRFVPHLDLSHVPATPVATLERAREIGLDAGLRCVYLGNVPGHPAENTHCHSCGTVLVRRHGLAVLEMNLIDGRCPRCGAVVPGRFSAGPAPREG